MSKVSDLIAFADRLQIKKDEENASKGELMELFIAEAKRLNLNHSDFWKLIREILGNKK